MFLHARHIQTKITTLLTATVFALVSPLIAIIGTAHATCGVTCTYSDTWGYQEVSSSGWLNGGGVPIYSNGPLAPGGPSPDTYNHVNNSGGTSTTTGIEWQCVELVNRLYLTKGWTTATWTGNGTDLYGDAPSSLTKEAQGHITYENVGDVIGMGGGSTGFGHVAIVNTSNGHIASQNTNAVYDTSFGLGNGSITYSGWANYTMQGIIHHPSGSTGSSSLTPAAISFNGNLNVFKVGGDNQVYQTYWNGSTWSGFSSLGGNMASNPALIINGTAQNIFVRGADNKIYTEYNSGSGWSGWTSLGTHQMKGNPTVMFYGTSMNVFALDTSNVPYEDTWTPTNGWLGWGSNSNIMASDPAAVTYGGNLHLIYRGGDNHVYDNVFSSSGWGGFGQVGSYAGSVTGNPSVLNYNAESELDVYFNTSVNHIYKTTYNGSSWGGWSDMGSSFTGDPYISTYGNDLQVYARDTSNNIQTRYWSYSGQNWSGWSSLGGSSNSLASDPFALQYGSENDVYANNGSANAFKDTFTSGWGGFTALN